MRWARRPLWAGLALVLARRAAAESSPAPIDLHEVVVRGDSTQAAPRAVTASQGTITGEDLQDLPLLRRGELLESVPGMVVTQHSGDGKANQYFLRGFNLDHGSDFAFSVDGVPVNLPSHAHGQGYSDLNFLIPELVAGIDFKKGPFYPEVGDFSGAGAADIRLVDRLPEGLASAQAGRFGYARLLAADSPRVGPGRLLAAFTYDHDDGPWILAEHANRTTGLMRYRWDRGADTLTATANISWAPDWRATDQVPQRALADGTLPRFGAVDPTDGGNTGRVALSVDWTRRSEGATTRVLAYGFYQRLQLFSDFTYFLDDPVHGDQFQQIDRRFVAGVQASRRWSGTWWGHAVENTAGVQLRNDAIPTSGLNHTAARRLVAVGIDDHVDEASAGFYGANRIRWTPWLRSHVGLRGDVFGVDVTSNTAANSGRASAGIVSPKLGLVFGPWRHTELYADVGAGFHSNDARGVTISVEPTTQQAVRPAPLLVRTKGAEVGVRRSAAGLTTTLALWILDSNSELTFQGDAGDTSANGPSRKLGVECAATYRPVPWVMLNVDAALTRTRYRVESDRRRRKSRTLHPELDPGGGLCRGHHREPAGSVWRRAAAVSRLTAPGRRRRRAPARFHDRQRADGLPARALGREHRGPEPVRRPCRRHRVLLRVPTGRRRRRRERRARAPRRADPGAGHPDRALLTRGHR